MADGPGPFAGLAHGMGQAARPCGLPTLIIWENNHFD